MEELKNEMKGINLYLDKELINNIKRVAKTNGLTMSAQIRLILINFIRDWKLNNKV